MEKYKIASDFTVDDQNWFSSGLWVEDHGIMVWLHWEENSAPDRFTFLN